MKFDELPVEIIKSILGRVDLSPIHAICKEFPTNPFTQALESILYQKVYYGPRNLDEEFVLVSIEELYCLARGEIKASVQCLRICADTRGGMDSGFYDLLRLAEVHPEFLGAIPNVEFEGFIKCFRQYASRVSIDHIHKWTLHDEETLDLDIIPPNLRKIKFDYCRCAKGIIDWPRSLSTMIFKGCIATFANEQDMVSLLDSSVIPKGLQKFGEATYLNVWNYRIFPPSLL